MGATAWTRARHSEEGARAVSIRLAFCDGEVATTSHREDQLPDGLIVSILARLLRAFSSSFTAPSFDSLVTLMNGWVLSLGRHTVAGTLRAAGAVGHEHICSFRPWVDYVNRAA
ncbi:MAG: hypothetical protein JW751_28135 [Polyangiaceae bacterium]|nr:hypothetical protein [Polyangiaceae bacterium]